MSLLQSGEQRYIKAIIIIIIYTTLLLSHATSLLVCPVKQVNLEECFPFPALLTGSADQVFYHQVSLADLGLKKKENRYRHIHDISLELSHKRTSLK